MYPLYLTHDPVGAQSTVGEVRSRTTALGEHSGAVPLSLKSYVGQEILQSVGSFRACKGRPQEGDMQTCIKKLKCKYIYLNYIINVYDISTTSRLMAYTNLSGAALETAL